MSSEELIEAHKASQLSETPDSKSQKEKRHRIEEELNRRESNCPHVENRTFPHLEDYYHIRIHDWHLYPPRINNT